MQAHLKSSFWYRGEKSYIWLSVSSLKYKIKAEIILTGVKVSLYQANIRTLLKLELTLNVTHKFSAITNNYMFKVSSAY